jgi:hypothetical protein
VTRDPYTTNKDLLTYARRLRDDEMRRVFLDMTLARLLDDRHYGPNDEPVSAAAILDCELALKYDCWGLTPPWATRASPTPSIGQR